VRKWVNKLACTVRKWFSKLARSESGPGVHWMA